MTNGTAAKAHCACNRRGLLLAGAGLMAGCASASHDAVNAERPIDVHHHFIPPFYQSSELEAWFRRGEASVREVTAWTEASMFAGLARAGGSRALLSLAGPGTALTNGADALSLARRCNDYASELVSGRRDQLGFFVTLPLPDIEASIAETERALSLPGAAGVALLTNYDGKYLGDPAFDRLLQNLHDRHALAFVHPTTAPCCVGLTPSVPAPLIEFPVDTGRAVGNLLWSGSFARYANLRFIFSHGGGITAMVAQRLQLVGLGRPDAESVAPGGVEAMLKRIYVDTASASHPAGIAAARAQFGDDRILFGSDAPWGDTHRSLASLAQLNLPDPVMRAIRYGNARQLVRVFD